MTGLRVHGYHTLQVHAQSHHECAAGMHVTHILIGMQAQISTGH